MVRSRAVYLALLTILAGLAVGVRFAPPTSAREPMPVPAAAHPVADGGEALPPIHLKARTIRSAPGLDPGTAPALLAAEAGAAAKAGSFHALVQFDHIPKPAEKAALERRGVHLQTYVPYQAWIARIDATRTESVRDLLGTSGIARNWMLSPVIACLLPGAAEGSGDQVAGHPSASACRMTDSSVRHIRKMDILHALLKELPGQLQRQVLPWPAVGQARQMPAPPPAERQRMVPLVADPHHTNRRT